MPQMPPEVIHSYWHSIHPPAYSRTHPTVWSKQSDSSEASSSPPRLPFSSPLPRPPIAPIGSFVRTFANEQFLSPKEDFPPLQPAAPVAPVRKAEDELEEGIRRFGLDRFAAVFVPTWLKNLPPLAFTLALPCIPPPYGYSSHLYPVPLTPLNTISISILAMQPVFAAHRPLDSARAVNDPGYYTRHFSELLTLQLSSQMTHAEDNILWSAQVERYDKLPGTYRISIPGIREDTPKLLEGDRVILRGLNRVDQVAMAIAMEADVVALDKRLGYVYVKSEFFGDYERDLPSVRKGREVFKEYQVKFMADAGPICAMQDAVRMIGLAIKDGHVLVRSWLFPLVKAYNIRSPSSADLPTKWRDPDLNTEQKNAIMAIVKEEHVIPYLISGPPGTGKTKTLVEAVLQILEHQPRSAVLVCAPSNPASDTIARRLSKHLSPTEMFRLNGTSRTFAEVDDQLLPYCYVSGEHFALPPVERLLQYRVVVASLVDSGVLVQGNVTNMASMNAEYKLRKTLHPGEEFKVGAHWTHLLIDEAAQASEPETLIPVSVVMPANLPLPFQGRPPTLVLCGDMHQLGPLVTSDIARDAELDVSLLERLFARDVHASHPLARGASPNERLPSCGTAPFANLIKNYRSLPSLLMVPSAMFYEDTLVPAARNNTLFQWSKFPNPRIPILFHGCDTGENWIDEGASWYNDGEIQLISELIQSFLKENPIRQKDIAVITPWRGQVWRMRAKLRSLGLSDIDVGNVETYQGGEFRVTFLSCVRSTKRFLKDDKKASMGFYNERRRFNVAITRAKEVLVVVGNAKLLKGDPYWNGFLQIMMRNNLYVGPKFPLKMTGAYTSHLEAKLRDGFKVSAEDEGEFQAGRLAEEMLRND